MRHVLSALAVLAVLLLTGCGTFRDDPRAALVPADGRYAVISDPTRQEQSWAPGAPRWRALRSAPDRQHDSADQGHARIDLAALDQATARPTTGFTGFQIVRLDPATSLRAGSGGTVEVRLDDGWTPAAMDARGVLTLVPGPTQLVPWPLIEGRLREETAAAKAEWAGWVARRPAPVRRPVVVARPSTPPVAVAAVPAPSPAAPAPVVFRPEDDGALPEVPLVLSIEEARLAHAAILAAMASAAAPTPAARADTLARTLALRGFASGFLRGNPDHAEMRAMAEDLDRRERTLRGL
jgi:hypothetical protein